MAGNASINTVCVVGLGYIGLPTAAFMASTGLSVIGVDVNPVYVEKINKGEVPFFEPDFEEMLHKVVHDGNLRAQVETPHADAYIIAVPTPFTGDHHVDDKYIRSATEAIAPQLKGNELVVLESTSPPGLTKQIADIVLEMRPDLTAEPGHENTVHFAHCPERVLPGRIMVEMTENDRVIGGLTPEASEIARELYATFCKGQLLITDATTAEMAKLTENSFRDVNIAFANELSVICDELGIDVWELIDLANHHPRVNILQPGPGVGGHCIAVDPWFIVSAAPESARLIRQARLINDDKPQSVIRKVRETIKDLENPTIAALGITFKANIDDVRESPSLNIVEEIAQSLPQVAVKVVEPNVEKLPPRLENLKNIEKLELDAAVDQADLVLILVDHDSFKKLTAEQLQGKRVVDTKGILR